MKRKTNLFYLEGQDSKFITFSNYAESLTGNFLSTDTKLFPSRFICLKLYHKNNNGNIVAGITNESKQHLIKYIASYYESKLAVLRDYYINNVENVEHNVLPLNYLLECLFKITEISDEGIKISESTDIKDLLEEYDGDLKKLRTDYVELVYISDITEQDYKGTYADTICSIDLNNYHTVKYVSFNNDNDDNVVTFNLFKDDENNKGYLYGWNNNIPENYSTLSSIPDLVDGMECASIINDMNNSNDDDLKDIIINTLFNDDAILIKFENDKYKVSNQEDIEILNSLLNNNDKTFFKGNFDGNDDIFVYDGSSINTVDVENYMYLASSTLSKLYIGEPDDASSLEFNMIIPLFDIVDINYKSNFMTIDKMSDDYDNNYIDLNDSASNIMYTTNVPLGIWFYTEDDSIKLYKDIETGFSQTWSLVISSQFKPFPYSKDMPNDMSTNYNTNAFSTFAQVLASQANMIESFNKMINQFSYLNDRISNIETQIANLGTSYNIDNIHLELIDYENKTNSKFNEFKNEILSYIDNLRWKTTI